MPRVKSCNWCYRTRGTLRVGTGTSVTSGSAERQQRHCKWQGTTVGHTAGHAEAAREHVTSAVIDVFRQAARPWLVARSGADPGAIRRWLKPREAVAWGGGGGEGG